MESIYLSETLGTYTLGQNSNFQFYKKKFTVPWGRSGAASPFYLNGRFAKKWLDNF